MIAEMSSYYGELQDHDAPSSHAVPRRTSVERKSRMSEMSLNLDDLSDLHHRHRSSHHSPRSSNNNSSSSSSCPERSSLGAGFSLSTWTVEPETTTGNLLLGAVSSSSAFLGFASLDDVLEDDDDDDDDDDEFDSDDNSDCEADNDEGEDVNGSGDQALLPSKSPCAALTPIPNSATEPISASKPSTHPSQASDANLAASLPSQLALCEGVDDGKSCCRRRRRRVTFEVPARLEEIREFEKPDYQDFTNLYYMAHEIQKMMDDVRKEDQLERHVVR